MVKHTPGPWSVFVSDDGGRWSGWPISILADTITDLNDDPRVVVRTGGFYPYEWDNGTSRDEANANARLIAAAPDMLDILKYVKQQCLFDDDDGSIGVSEDAVIPSDLFNKICAAIAKAEGR